MLRVKSHTCEDKEAVVSGHLFVQTIPCGLITINEPQPQRMSAFVNAPPTKPAVGVFRSAILELKSV